MSNRSFDNVLRYIRQLAGLTSQQNLPDQQLLAQFLNQGEEAAFEALVQRHGRLVWSVCRRVLGRDSDAEDAFQATFLVLARKAGSIRKWDSLSSWLYGVAYRVAVDAKAKAARRQGHERQAAIMATALNSSGENREALWQVLDEELCQLPEKYRAPLVLCYLEGKSQAEAAAQLGWPRGSMAKRLSAALDRLRGRLRRRDVTLSVAALGGALGEMAASAAAPAAVIQGTVTAAMLFAAGSSVGGTATAAATVALAEGVLHTMWMTKLKIVLGLVLALSVLGTGAGVIAHRTMARAQAGGAVATGVVAESGEKETGGPADPPANLQEMVLPLDKAIVHRLGVGQGVVVLEKAPSEGIALVTAFSQQLLAATKGAISVKAGTPLSLLAACPTLDSPDTASPVRLVRRGRRLTLDIHYTSVVRAEGMQLRQNYIWTPFVQIPVDLPPGKYQLEVTWRVIPSKLGLGTHPFKPQPPLGQKFEFAVDGVVPVGGSKETNKPAKEAGGQTVNGLKLTLTADKTETVMRADGTDAEPVKLQLTLTNVSQKPLRVPFYRPALRFEISSPVPKGFGEKGIMFYTPVSGPGVGLREIPPGQDLAWPGEEMFFPGSLETGNSTRAEFVVNQPGEYRIRCTYVLANTKLISSWTGKVTSNELVLTVKEANKPAKEAGGQAVNGLKLTPTADKTETVMKADAASDSRPPRHGRNVKPSSEVFTPEFLPGDVCGASIE